MINQNNLVKYHLTWVRIAYCVNSLVSYYLTCVFFAKSKSIAKI